MDGSSKRTCETMEFGRLPSSYLICLVFIILLMTSRSGLAKELMHVTETGTFIGLSENIELQGEYKYASKFLGIPYAKPPTGDRRFARPVKYGRFTQPYNATYNRAHCIQTFHMYRYIEVQRFQQNEDCLYLNIYVPGNFTSTGNKYPVMLYIHGGSFASGGGDIYEGDKLSAFYDVIIVTINYRLNALGFLSDGSKNSGNFGLWDMKMAIQWVHDNIEDFSGDSEKVTIFGNSAGGAAVLYQAINPDNKGLFQRVIAQSGSCFAFWAVQRKPLDNFNRYVTKSGCDSDSKDEIMKCLREVNIERLRVDVSDFVPSVDDDFLPELPKMLLKSNSRKAKAALKFFSELDLINGVASQDGAFARDYWSNRMTRAGISNIDKGVPRNFFEETYVPYMLDLMFDDKIPVIEHSAINKYTDWSMPENPLVVRRKLVDFESDVTFFVPAVLASRGHRSSLGKTASKNSFFYVFDQKPDFAPEPEWLTGATHFMEVPYIFGFPEIIETKLIEDYHSIIPFQVSENDKMLSSKIMRYWTTFAKTG